MKKVIVLILCVTFMLVGCNGANTKSGHLNIGNEDIRNYLIENKVAFLLGDEEVLYKEIENDITINILNEAFESDDALKCSLIYEKDELLGKVTLDLNFDDLNKKREVLELEPKQFDLSFIGTFEQADMDVIISHLFKDGLYLKKEGLEATFEEQQLLNIDLSDDVVVMNKGVLRQDVLVTVGMNVINADAEIHLFYERDDDNKWTIVHSEVNDEKTCFTSPRDLIGRWGAPYLYSGYNSFGVLVIQSYDAKTATYKAIFEPHRRVSTTHITHLGYYSVDITYDLEHDQLLFNGVEWATENSTYPLFDFEITFDEDLNLYSRPVNWLNETPVKFTFTQDYDTYYIFNNEALMMSTGKSSYNEGLDFQNELLNIKTIRKYYDSMDNKTSVEVNGESYTFTSDQIQTVLPMSDLALIETDKWIQNVKINIMIDDIDLRAIATVEYTQGEDEKWIVSSIAIDDKQTMIEVQ